MMRQLSILAAVAAFALPGTPAEAQFADLGLSAEFRVGALAPTGNWEVPQGNTTLRAGTGVLLTGGLRLALPAGLSAYGSGHYGLPGCEDCPLFDLDDQLTDTGLGFGLGYELFDLPPLLLRLDVGGIVHQLAFRGDGETRRSDHGVGIEAGMTGSIEIRPSLALEPSFAWRAYSARFQFEDGSDREIEVRYLAPSIGLRYRFW